MKAGDLGSCFMSCQSIRVGLNAPRRKYGCVNDIAEQIE